MRIYSGDLSPLLIVHDHIQCTHPCVIHMLYTTPVHYIRLNLSTSFSRIPIRIEQRDSRDVKCIKSQDSSKYRHIPKRTFARKPTNRPVFMGGLWHQKNNQSYYYETKYRSPHENKTFVVSCSLPSSQNTAGFSSCTKKKGKRGKKKPMRSPGRLEELGNDDERKAGPDSASATESIH